MARPRKRRHSNPEAEVEEQLPPSSSSPPQPVEHAGWTAFCEEHVEFMEQLPLSLCRNFKLMAEIDSYSSKSHAKLHGLVQEYMKRRKQSIDQSNSEPAGEPLERRSLLAEISRLSQECLHAGEEKVNLAQAAYDSVDRHVHLLEIAINSCEEHLARYDTEGQGAADAEGALEGTQLLPPDRNHARHSRDPQSSQAFSERSRRLASRALKAESQEPDSRTHFIKNSRSRRGSQPDLPTEVSTYPHEPRYCICNQISFGEMVACDAADCDYEWFHLTCVGLKEAPKKTSKWYCDMCRARLGLSRARSK